ncbi:hypothetical protein EC973_001763 [Apophysomyces ossiformis]|uniref:Uncharacterized protein n=1 Tax=Apophysomyces ossiformis TaxID=679940 RepID=A0A8H7BPQ1_9FUNG|nr:hypothetical protein EC973_001763 [Apophysomyces ossiformis]
MMEISLLNRFGTGNQKINVSAKAIVSMAIFPILQWSYRNNLVLREVAPQLAYALQVLIVATLGLRSHIRFTRLLRTLPVYKHAKNLVTKLAYFRDMNKLLTISLYSYGISLFILSADGLTPNRTVNNNRFAMDLLIGNCNLCVVFIWITTIAIFQPQRPCENDNQIDAVEMRPNQMKPFRQRIDNFVSSRSTADISTSTAGKARSPDISHHSAAVSHDRIANTTMPYNALEIIPPFPSRIASGDIVRLPASHMV